MNTQSFGSRLFKIAIFILIFLIAAIIALQLYQAEWKKSSQTELRFEATELPFIHEFNSKNMLPFLGSAAFDADGDGIDELFLGGGLNQDNKLFRYSSDGFVDTGMRFKKPDNQATRRGSY